jgi:hypothetical protein
VRPRPYSFGIENATSSPSAVFITIDPVDSCKTPRFAGLSLARSAGLEPATFSVRSHSPSRTGRDSGGQGETKQRFYQVLALLEGQGGTGRDTRLRSDCGQCSRHPGFRTIGDSGGCEKRASEPGDEAFEVGASHFSMLRPSCRLCFTARTPLLPLRPPPGPARRCRCSRRWRPRYHRRGAGVCRQERSRGCPRARR